MHTLSRRSFLKLTTGTVVLTVTQACSLLVTDDSDITAQPQTGGDAWSGLPGKAQFRIDGMPKVLGEKIYARDYRAKDIPGWPDQERMAMVLRANCVNRNYLGLDLSVLGDLPRPLVVDQATLDKDNILPAQDNKAPAGWPSKTMVQRGCYAGYYGQPIVILIFESALVYRKAFRLLQFNHNVVSYGPEITRSESVQPYSPPTYLTRYNNEFSQTLNGTSDPHAQPLTRVDKKAKKYRSKIRDYTRLNTMSGSFSRYEGTGRTQLIVPMFMEPESGLGWYDTSHKKLNILLGTQSPDGDLASGASLLGADRVKSVDLISCYPGGGFGGRDSSPFTALLIIASYYSNGPVRLAYDRFGEFQAGLTQLRSNIKQSIFVNQQGKFEAIETHADLPSGGRNNYSQYVAELAAYCATGAYKIPKVIVDAMALPTTTMPAGSMRGFGGPQASFALETLVDRVARQRKIDPIKLRLNNVLQKGDHIGTGAPISQVLRFDEMCHKALKHPLWQEREQKKIHYAQQNKRYGVGFALANQAYGTGQDGVMADVSLSRDGNITVSTNAVDMGNGSATTLALATAVSLGQNADKIDMGEVTIFDALELSDDPIQTGAGATNAKSWDNPYYTSAFSMSSSACITAFQQYHAVTQASLVLFDTAIWPTAAVLWGLDVNSPLKSQARWQDGELFLTGFIALPLPLIARKLHNNQGITGAMIHACFEGRWVKAKFRVEGELHGWAIDGLNLLVAGEHDYVRFSRVEVLPPPVHAANYGRNLFSPSGTLIAVIIDNHSGKISVDAVHTYLNAGKIHQPDLLSGQYQGGVAMGIGYALLENLPPDEGGNGLWNLNRYHVPLAGDLPLERITLETLEPVQDEPGRGIAEAVLCPIAPAIANAIADATGGVFQELPITADKVKRVLS